PAAARQRARGSGCRWPRPAPGAAGTPWATARACIATACGSWLRDVAARQRLATLTHLLSVAEAGASTHQRVHFALGSLKDHNSAQDRDISSLDASGGAHDQRVFQKTKKTCDNAHL